MYPVVWCCLLAATAAMAPSSEEILTRIADSGSRRPAVAYSGRREYRLQNTRFAQEATVFVHMTHRPGEEKRFTVLRRSGSDRLAGIVERLLASEADASRPRNRAEFEISPANYSARFRGTGSIAGRTCYIVDVVPKRKSKFLIQGTLWVEPGTYAVVRLEGSPLANISMWIGRPDVVGEFSEIGGFWLPSYVRSVSSTMLLGTSELEIRYTDYRIEPDTATSAQAGRSGSATRPN